VAIVRNEWHLIAVDKGLFVLLLAMPIVLMGFVKPIYRPVLEAQGYSGATGAEQAVPNVAVVFAFFVIGHVGLMFYREHAWGTWERLRAVTSRPTEIIAGKAIPIFALAFAQQVVLLAGAWLLYGLEVRGSVLGLAVVAASFSTSLLAFGVALASLFERIEQFSVVQTLAMMFFAGFGGAIAPSELLPAAVRAIGYVTPTYWAIDGYRATIVDGAGVGDVAVNIAVLLAFAGLFGAVALRAFRAEDAKEFWA
jgi:ABC-2 type transport system permease protein